mmetsp:Transcript_92134/g.160013  ORF Transcript_92134/g.160013 Transcript_92134/m.160013 type:complete len:353 (-) Transcript_92134:1377-2435(-)
MHIVATCRYAQHHEVWIASVEMRRVELGNVRPEGAVQRHKCKAHLSRIVAVVKREQHKVRARDAGQGLNLCCELLHQLVAPHLQTLLVLYLCVVPESSHLAQVTLEYQTYPDLHLLLHLLFPPLFCQEHITITALHHLCVCRQRVWRPKDLCCAILADVDQHVGVVDSRPHGRLGIVEFSRGFVKIVPNRQVTATIIVLNSRIFTAWRHCIVIKLEPAGFQVGSNVNVVVSTVDISTMHNHGVKNVTTSTRRKRAKVQSPVKLKTGVQFHHIHLLKVKMEALQLQVQDRRKGEETDSFLCTLFAVPLGLVRIVTFEGFLCCKIAHGFLDVLQLLTPLTLDIQLNVIKRFVPL